MNKNFGKLDNQVIIYAPSQITVRNILYTKPTDQQYIDAGWKYVIINKPEQKSGYSIVFKDYTVEDDTIYQNYELKENAVQTPKQISKLYLRIALIKLGLWDMVQEWMSSIDIDLGDGKTINCFQAYTDALVIDTSNELFKPYLEMAKEKFKDYISSEDVDKLLIRCRSE